MAQTPLHIALIGCGHLGSFHLEKVLLNRATKLCAIIDPNVQRRAHAKEQIARHTLETSEQTACAIVSELSQLTADLRDKIDAAIVACPTPLHQEIGLRCLQHGWHVLIEKPLTTDRLAAETLVQEAERKGKVLAVGHIERFNPAVEAALPLIKKPRFVTTERLGPFSERSIEVDVIYDMMVHDFDLLRASIDAPLIEVRAIGVSVLTDTVDMASVRLAFADGSVAQLSAGRASLKPCRKLRYFTPERYVSIDCHARKVSSVRREPAQTNERFARLVPEDVAVVGHDPLAAQLDDFLAACHGEKAPRNTGLMGLEAVRMAEAVQAAMARAEPRYIENDSPQLQL